MRKFISCVMLMVAMVLQAVAPLSAQTLAKRDAKNPGARVQHVVPDIKQQTLQLRVRGDQTGYSTNLRRVAASTFDAPSATLRNQMREATGGIELWGNVLHSDTMPGSTTKAHAGIWRFNLDGNFLQGYSTAPGGCSAAVCLDGIYHNYYYVRSLLGTLYPYYEAFEIDTWDKVARPVDKVTLVNLPLALCTDGTNVYGQHLNDNRTSYRYGKFDVNTNTWTDFCDVEVQWNACAYGNDGNVYAIDMAGDCYKVVPETGVMTKLGATGVVPMYVTGAVVDKKSGRMFWTVCPEDETGNLYEVNTTTGVATKLLQFQYNDEVAGLVIPFIAADNAPAVVENLQPNFPNGGLSGTVDFKCPTTTYDGTAATGELTYTVLVNKEVKATGTCAFGQQVNAPVTLPEAGQYTFAVYVSNAAGDGPKTIVRDIFIGKDTPTPTPSVTISYADGKFNVNWEAVTTTVNGGYMDLSKVNYTVTRFPDNVVVGENVTGTSLQDPVAEPDSFTTYNYSVVVNCEGLSSSSTLSNYISLGDLFPPYVQEFETADELNAFVIIDANCDNQTRGPRTFSGRKIMGCINNKTKAMDDWLITPSITLEAGKAYRISIDARNRQLQLPERVEMKMGQGTTVEAMTKEVIPATLLEDVQWHTLEAIIIPEVSGKYNFGIHGISDPDMFFLYVDSFTVSAAMDPGVPGLATDLAVASDPTGALKATISGNAPTLTVNDQTLTSASKIVLSRDGNKIDSVENVTPGANFSLVDPTATKAGTYTWTITCYNDKGEGRSANVTGFVGIDKPSPVSNVKMIENPEGTVNISWDASTTDIHGTSLQSTPVTYMIVDAANPKTVIATGITETSYSYQAVEAGEQDFVQVGVVATTSVGQSTGVASPFRAVGTPTRIPWFESFPEKSLNSLLGFSTDAGKGVAWALCTDGELGLTSYDNDGGFIAGKFTGYNDAGTIFTGKTDLANAVNPVFSFYTFNIADNVRDINEIEVLARTADADNWTVLSHGTIDSLCNFNGDSWNKITVSLNDFKGKQVQVGVRFICKWFSYCMLDNMVVEDQYAHNLIVRDIDAPEVVNPNEEFTVSALVENRGTNPADVYTVEFYRNNETAPFKVCTGEALAPGASASYNVPAVLGYGEDEGSARYRAVINYAADMNSVDNTSEEVTVTRQYSDKPAPENLVGVTEGNRVSLTWTAPSALTQRYEAGISDDVEGYKAWAYKNVGAWTFVDGDLSKIGGFQGLEIPGSPAESLRSFIVFRQDAAIGFDQTFAAHSGSQFFGSMFRWDGGLVDDWAISPKLSGAAQTVSFWAKSYSGSYMEKMEILYSISGKETTDFVSVKVVDPVPDTWTEYTFEVPAGATYFAVRNCGANRFCLMLDDFTMETAPDEVVGYNVYRDNVKLNNELITGTSFVDENCPSEGNPAYVVTAVYAFGAESAPTNVFYARGVEAIEAGVTVETGNGFIAIAGAEGKLVSITAINGIRYFNRVAEGEVRVELAAGVYLVRVANGTLKVVVR